MEELTDLHKLPKGTKLVCDARKAGRYARPFYYPALVASEKEENPELGALIRFPNDRYWIKTHKGYLRFPTERELKKFKWPVL